METSKQQQIYSGGHRPSRVETKHNGYKSSGKTEDQRLLKKDSGKQRKIKMRIPMLNDQLVELKTAYNMRNR